nr:unnamed protein product [Digitaria exilis]
MVDGDNSPTPIQPSPAKHQNESSSTTAQTTIHTLGDDHPPADMNGGRKRRRGRSKARRGPPIHKLGEDLLLEIFLRLPSLATLVRAALTCRAWRHAVASSPSFRRRFRAAHPPPLLGLFFEPHGPVQAPNTPVFPSFVPARRRDRDLTAAFLVAISSSPPSRTSPTKAPAGTSADVFDLGHEDMFDGRRGHYAQTLGNGQFFQHVPASSGDDESWLQDDGGMQANGFLYWVYEDWKYLVSLDTSTMEFCVTELPHSSGYSSFCVGETKDGTTCIVFSDDSDDLNIGVLMPTRGDDGVEKWVLDQIDLLDTELERVLRVGLEETRLLNDLVDEPSDLLVLAVCDGYVYLSTSEMYHDPQTPCWFLSLCLETVTLERLFRRTFDTPVHPYIMAWPPSLVGNFGRFALEGAPSH